MQKRVIILFVFITFASFLLAETVSLRNDPEINAAFVYIESLVEGLRKDQNIPGLSAAVVIDQDMVWGKGYGFANLEKKIEATPDSIYRIASITKLFTATMLMQLRDKGKLQLDDPLVKYIPQFLIKNPFEGARPITLRQIASHSSGLPREAPLDYMKNLNFPSTEEILNSLKEAELIFKPLSEFKYSNLGMALLGHALEKAAGQPYQEYIREKILVPLEMSKTAFEIEPRIERCLATGYTQSTDKKSFKPAPLYDMKGMSPCGQLYSTVEDMSRFMAFQFHESGGHQDKVLSRFSIDEMHNVEIMDEEWKTGVGIGWAVIRLGEETAIGHSGGIHGYQTNILLVPRLKVGTAVFANSSNASPMKISQEILGILIPAVKRVKLRIEKREEPDALPKEWIKYTGVYEWKELGQAIEIKIKGNRLVVISPNDPGLIIYLSPEKENVFRMKEGPFDGEFLRFQLDKEGKVINAYLGNYCFERK